MRAPPCHTLSEVAAGAAGKAVTVLGLPDHTDYTCITETVYYPRREADYSHKLFAV